MINVRIESDVNKMAEKLLARMPGWPKKSKHALVNDTLRDQFIKQLSARKTGKKEQRTVA